MEESPAARQGLLAFYAAFSSGDAGQFADVIARRPGVSVIGTAPGEGHDDRDGWIEAYRTGIAEAGMSLRGGEPRAWAEGTVGWAVDEPTFVLPDGSTLPTRLTAVLCEEGGAWRVVHLHFSVGVADEDAIQPAPGAS